MPKITNKEYKCEKCGDITTINGTNHHCSFRGCKKCNDSGAFKICQTPEGIELFNKLRKDESDLRRTLPISVLCPTSQVIHFQKNIMFDKKKSVIYVKIRWDDSCSNRHNSFAITGDIYTSRSSKDDRYAEMGGCIHDEIVKYFPEFKKLINWHFFSSDGYDYRGANIIYFAEQNDIKTARNLANWDNATIEQLKNESILLERLPSLMDILKKDIENLGMVY